jgi:hypothetical protein
MCLEKVLDLQRTNLQEKASPKDGEPQDLPIPALSAAREGGVDFRIQKKATVDRLLPFFVISH